MNLFPVGDYAAKVADIGAGFSKTGTAYVRVKFQITEGELAGRTIAQDFYMTEKTWEGTTKTLVALGWNKKLNELKTSCTKICSIKVVHEVDKDQNEQPKLDDEGKTVYRARVRWANPLQQQLSQSDAERLAQMLRKFGADIEAGSPPAPPAPPPAPPAQADQADQDDDQLPF